MRLEEPPRPVDPDRGGARQREDASVRPSVRRRSSTLQFDTRVRLINVMLEMPVIVVFTVSSSVQFIPKAVRATKPLIAFIAVLVSKVAFLKNPKNSRVTLCRRARSHACADPKPLNRGLGVSGDL